MDYSFHVALRDLSNQSIELQVSSSNLTELVSLSKPSIAGQEDLKGSLMNIASDAGNGMLTVSKWLGGQSLSLFTKLFKEANTQISLSLASNKSLIGKTGNVLGKETLADSYSISSATAASLTSTGKFGDFFKDADDLVSAAGLLKEHVKEVNNYLDRSVAIAVRVARVKSNEDGVKLLTEFANLKFPKFDLPNKPSNVMFVSDVLPGGKVFKQKYSDEEGSVEYFFTGDKPSGEASEYRPDQGELKTLLNKLTTINELHYSLVNANIAYLRYIEKWNKAVSAGFKHIDDAEDMASSTKSDLNKLLSGSKPVLSFYGDFTPRVITYTDKYIHDVLVLISKLFN